MCDSSKSTINKSDPLYILCQSMFDKLSLVEKRIISIGVHERNPLGDTYLETEEVCALLKICKRTLQKHRDEATISFIQFGGKTLYKTEDIKKLLQENYQEALQ